MTGVLAYEHELEGIEEEIAELKESVEVYQATYHEAVKDINTWNELKERIENEETVFPPKAKTKQTRKKLKYKNSSRKRRQVEEESDVEFIESGGNGSSKSENKSDTDGIEAPQEPLTLEDIKQRLADLKDQRKNSRNEKKALKEKIKDLKPAIRTTKSKIADVKAQILAICIKGRNKYLRGAIQQDFAAGIKELD
ncbi:hypothetical protein SLS60_005979 [Paraconiothyrium brasiliense]|uniref:Uncharacterized protein n=1 Tax=Paraconiothyrium brasiliense TaxID=300254 RepID=A0ABR3REE0_9PLEO